MPRWPLGSSTSWPQRYPRSDEAPASVYWAGRAWAIAGDSVKAHARWRKAAEGDPVSYYASLAARRLGLPGVGAAAGAGHLHGRPRSRQRRGPRGAARPARTRRRGPLGVRSAGRSPCESSRERLLAVANALRGQGLASQAIQLARKALARGAPADARTYRLLYPVVHEDALLAEASEQRSRPELRGGADPAGVHVQPRRHLARGRPGADAGHARPRRDGWRSRWLSGVGSGAPLPAGREPAARLLSPPGAGGAATPSPAQVLAAYNAGVSRVERWAKRTGVDDPEVFAERIPFVETRGYVADHQPQPGAVPGPVPVARRELVVDRSCHPERSEGGHARYGPLRFAQGDSAPPRLTVCLARPASHPGQPGPEHLPSEPRPEAGLQEIQGQPQR